ncbi:DUF4215 domain-containing protein [Vulgatibacter sp.]|uniref:DUF4215 domain-containing protein n=1 Tax=Vulgatibacter sp. TaxID=1971226 RepID=UPI00356ADD3D
MAVGRIIGLVVLSLQLAGCGDEPDIVCEVASCENVCGDGVVSAGVDECDDANDDEGDACLPTCTLDRCGDGIVHADTEECDDGNEDESDACLRTCTLARCGDGVVHAGVEECDEGERNSDAGPGTCRSNCTLPRCGDGAVDPGESCDDGNTVDDDGCDADCSFPDVVQLVSGSGSNCVLFDAGNVRCWGSNAFGELGYGHSERIGDDEPAGAFGDVDIGGRAVQIAMGSRHTCVLLESGSVRCWGQNWRGQLGPDVTDDVLGDEPGEMPPPDLPIGGPAVGIFASPWHTCVVRDDGDVRCWGKPPVDRIPGLENVDEVGVVRQLVFGAWHACALLDPGSVRCWTTTVTGYHGYGHTNSVALEDADVVDVGGTVVQLDLSGEHTCAVLESGAVHCWGNGADGRLGYGSVENVGDDETPRDAGAVGLGEPAVQVAAGEFHSCALLASGRVRCWGQLWYGQLGYGDRFPRTAQGGAPLALGDEAGEMPPPEVDVGGRVVQISAGASHTCALLDHGGVRCWGGGGYDYQLGYGRPISLDEPPASAGDVPLYANEPPP